MPNYTIQICYLSMNSRESKPKFMNVINECTRYYYIDTNEIRTDPESIRIDYLICNLIVLLLNIKEIKTVC